MSNATEIAERIAALQGELKALQDNERKAKETRLKAFQKQWQFTIVPKAEQHWDKVWDDTIHKYLLSGVILNSEDYVALGGSKDTTKGSMAYLYNSQTKRIVMRLGGGTIFIPDENWSKQDKYIHTAETYNALAVFIADNPNGGDVTAIITGNPDFHW